MKRSLIVLCTVLCVCIACAVAWARTNAVVVGAGVPVAVAGGGPVAVEQSNSSSGGTFGTNWTHAVSFSTTPDTGNVSVVNIAVYSGFASVADLVTVADNQGNTYTKRNEVGRNNSNNFRVLQFTAPITTASGTFTVTATSSNTDDWATHVFKICISEVSGVDTDDIIDESGAAYGSSATASVDINAQQADTMVVAMCMQDWDVTMVATDWDTLCTFAGPEQTMAKVVSRTGNYDPSFTLGLGNDWCVAGIGLNME